MSLQLSDQLIEQIVKKAVEAAIEQVEKEKQKDQKDKHDRRLRNTNLLLKHYRSFKLHAKDLEDELDTLDQEPEDIIEQLYRDDFAVESIKRSKTRTLAMIKFIDRMVRVYKEICETKDRPEDLRRYQTIYDLYISDDKKTYEEIADCHVSNVRTAYRDRKKAVEDLSILIFGVDAIKF